MLYEGDVDPGKMAIPPKVSTPVWYRLGTVTDKLPFLKFELEKNGFLRPSWM
jgi:hypothetical protein